MCFSPDGKLMALAIPAEDEKAASLLNVYDVFAPTTKPLWVWEWCVSSRRRRVRTTRRAVVRCSSSTRRAAAWPTTA